MISREQMYALEGRSDRESAVVVDCNSRVIFHRGQYEKKVIARSTAKLIQVLPVYLLGLHKKYHLNSDELAVMSSSHLAQKQHVDVLESLLRKTGIREEDINIALSAPSGRIAYDIWKRAKSPKRKIYHMCTGNHIGMMLAQRELTGKVDNYGQPSSCIQKWIRGLMAELCECPKSMIEMSQDGCGIPAYILPMKCIAIAYKNMVSESSCLHEPVKNAAIYNVHEIWKNPLMLEGDGCLSTILSSDKGVIAKTGAGGLLAVGVAGFEYGILIQSSVGSWLSVALMVDDIFKRIGYCEKSTVDELKEIEAEVMQLA